MEVIRLQEGYIPLGRVEFFEDQNGGGRQFTLYFPIQSDDLEGREAFIEVNVPPDGNTTLPSIRVGVAKRQILEEGVDSTDLKYDTPTFSYRFDKKVLRTTPGEVNDMGSVEFWSNRLDSIILGIAQEAVLSLSPMYYPIESLKYLLLTVKDDDLSRSARKVWLFDKVNTLVSAKGNPVRLMWEILKIQRESYRLLKGQNLNKIEDLPSLNIARQSRSGNYFETIHTLCRNSYTRRTARILNRVFDAISGVVQSLGRDRIFIKNDSTTIQQLQELVSSNDSSESTKILRGLSEWNIALDEESPTKRFIDMFITAVGASRRIDQAIDGKTELLNDDLDVRDIAVMNLIRYVVAGDVDETFLRIIERICVQEPAIT